MMLDKFQDTTRQLWDQAGLGEPRFGADRSLVLSFDDVDLTFTPSADQEFLMVTTDCGSLETFGADNAEQMETLLKLGFALLYSHDVLVHLQEDRVVINGRYTYETQSLQKLGDLVCDVASAAQTVARLAHTSQTHLEPIRSGAPTSLDDIVIFQP